MIGWLKLLIGAMMFWTWTKPTGWLYVWVWRRWSISVPPLYWAYVAGDWTIRLVTGEDAS